MQGFLGFLGLTFMGDFIEDEERIWQIEAKALARLRKHKDTKKLHEYLR
jgi:RNA polymerase primary sigma factor